jgi:bifunctional ADP-heptose synthase (sugar kinase/adenylyltransferase)
MEIHRIDHHQILMGTFFPASVDIRVGSNITTEQLNDEERTADNNFLVVLPSVKYGNFCFHVIKNGSVSLLNDAKSLAETID